MIQLTFKLLIWSIINGFLTINSNNKYYNYNLFLLNTLQISFIERNTFVINQHPSRLSLHTWISITYRDAFYVVRPIHTAWCAPLGVYISEKRTSVEYVIRVWPPQIVHMRIFTWSWCARAAMNGTRIVCASITYSGEDARVLDIASKAVLRIASLRRRQRQHTFLRSIATGKRDVLSPQIV